MTETRETVYAERRAAAWARYTAAARTAWAEYETDKQVGWGLPYWQEVAARAVGQYGAMQDPIELAALLGILMSQVGPRTVLEIGTGSGGSAWAWCQLPDVTHVVTVDIRPGLVDLSWARPTVAVDLVAGASHSLDTLAKVAVKLDGEHPDLLFIDGDHSGPMPAKDVDNYAPLVAPGGVVVLHDTRGCPGRYDIEVWPVFQQLRRGRPSLELAVHPTGPFGTGIVWM